MRAVELLAVSDELTNKNDSLWDARYDEWSDELATHEHM